MTKHFINLWEHFQLLVEYKMKIVMFGPTIVGKPLKYVGKSPLRPTPCLR